MLQLLFVHGWGFGPDIWTPLLKRLEFSLRITCINLGYFGEIGPPQDIPEDTLCIGHSLGALWLLKQAPAQITGFVSICGFDRFAPLVDSRIIQTMKAGIKRDARHQLEKFWTACGSSSYQPNFQPDSQTLLEGLEFLETADGRKELNSIHCPVYPIAARDDQITPAEMTEKVWGDYSICCTETGGHMLPLTRPDWLAEKLHEIISNHR